MFRHFSCVISDMTLAPSGHRRKKKAKREVTVRKCSSVGCEKYARGKTGLCIRHNGGNRCAHALCTKSAQGTTNFCSAHGGGVRCSTAGCPKGAQRGGKCYRCGGGDQCGWPSCLTKAQERIVVDEVQGIKEPRCAKHGGSRLCSFPECLKTACSYSPPPFYCGRHGGIPQCITCKERNVVLGFNKCSKCGGGRQCALAKCRNISASPRAVVCHKHRIKVQLAQGETTASS